MTNKEVVESDLEDCVDSKPSMLKAVLVCFVSV